MRHVALTSSASSLKTGAKSEQAQQYSQISISGLTPTFGMPGVSSPEPGYAAADPVQPTAGDLEQGIGDLSP
jgi:hypothetical protein